MSIPEAEVPAGRTRAPSAAAVAEIAAAIESRGRFGRFGGQYAPETLMTALEELEREWRDAVRDRRYLEELARHRRTFIGRPTPLYYAENLTRHYGGAEI